MKPTKRYWFKRRRYGYGWFPVTMEGWLSVLIFVGLLVISAKILLKDVPEDSYQAEVGYFLGLVFVATLGLIFAGYKKGPKPKWRWGKKPDDNPEEDF